jgi:UDP-glucuronate 4-epimerase
MLNSAPLSTVEGSPSLLSKRAPTMQKTILLTGCAGFIGFHLGKRLLQAGATVVGIDNLNDYYDVTLKNDRLAIVQEEGLDFRLVDLSRRGEVAQVFSERKFDCVINLAAQAGVRYSLTNPQAYVDSNLTGFVNILEGCRQHSVGHLIYASSSSVYGANRQMPFCVEDRADHPLSLYGATKRANELLAHSYASMFNLPSTGLRFFTVYGPWGRPDMALYIFARAILEGRPIDLYNYGKMRRDFTYVDDIVEAIVRLVDVVPTPDPEWNGSGASSPYAHRVYNIGNNRPTELLLFVELIEKYLGKKAERNLLPLQVGDVVETFADVDALEKAVAFRPSTPIEEGIRRSMEWYRRYRGI